jgi:hypothetical protein
MINQAKSDKKNKTSGNDKYSLLLRQLLRTTLGKKRKNKDIKTSYSKLINIASINNQQEKTQMKPCFKKKC